MVKDMNQYALYGTCCIQTDASERASCSEFRVVEVLHEVVQLMLIGFVLYVLALLWTLVSLSVITSE